jgi:hypothetical protein
VALRVSPGDVEVNTATNKRARGYLRWYPAAWRARYGEEFVAHLEIELNERPFSLARTSDIVAHGFLARFKFQHGLRFAMRAVTAVVLISATVVGVIALTHTWAPLVITSGNSHGITGVGESSRPSQVNDLAFNFMTPQRVAIQITSVKVVPLRGFLIPEVVGVEFSAHSSDLANGHGWPVRLPKQFSTDLGRAPLVRAIGTTVALGRTNVIWLGLRAPRLNHAYAIDAVRVTYKYHGSSHTMTISQAATPDVICASSSRSSEIPSWCSQNIEAANSLALFLKAGHSKPDWPSNEALLVVQFAANETTGHSSLALSNVRYWAARFFPAASNRGITSVTRVVDDSGSEFRMVIRKTSSHSSAVCAFRNPFTTNATSAVAYGTGPCPS